LDKKIGIGQPKRIENAKILVANTAMDTDKVKIYGARVRVDSMSKVAEIEGAEKEKMREKVKKIIGHGINCFVNRQLIYNFPEELFADAGILAIEHADFDGIERLALVTGGEIASTFDNPESVKLGQCKLIEEIMIGEDKLIHFSGVEMGQACTIVLRGARYVILIICVILVRNFFVYNSIAFLAFYLLNNFLMLAKELIWKFLYRARVVYGMEHSWKNFQKHRNFKYLYDFNSKNFKIQKKFQIGIIGIFQFLKMLE